MKVLQGFPVPTHWEVDRLPASHSAYFRAVRSRAARHSYQRPYLLTVAHVRVVIEAMRIGSSARKFRASQVLSTMSS